MYGAIFSVTNMTDVWDDKPAKMEQTQTAYVDWDALLEVREITADDRNRAKDIEAKEKVKQDAELAKLAKDAETKKRLDDLANKKRKTDNKNQKYKPVVRTCDCGDCDICDNYAEYDYRKYFDEY